MIPKYENIVEAISLKEQIKTIDRVKDNGEVFTSIYDVKRMCELCKDGLNNIEEIVIEPSCGTGNFLIEILDYKIKYAESISTDKDLNINIIKAVSTILDSIPLTAFLPLTAWSVYAT